MGNYIELIITAGVMLLFVAVGGRVLDLIFRIPPIKRKLDRFFDSLPMGGRR